MSPSLGAYVAARRPAHMGGDTKSAWLMDDAQVIEVTQFLYERLRTKYPFLLDNGKDLNFSNDNPQEALHRVFNRFRRLFPDQEPFIGRVIAQKSPNHRKGTETILGYTVTTQKEYNTQVGANMASTDYWAHWRSIKVLLHGDRRQRASFRAERHRQRLHFLCFAVLKLAGTGFYTEDGELELTDIQSTMATEYLEGHAKEPKMAHVLDNEDRGTDEGFLRRLAMSVVNRNPDGPAMWMEQLLNRYIRFIIHHRRKELDSYRTRDSVMWAEKDKENPVSHKPSSELYRHQLAVLQDVLWEQCEQHKDLLTGFPDHWREGVKGLQQARAESVGEPLEWFTVPDRYTAAMLQAVNKLHRQQNKQKVFRIFDFDGSDDERTPTQWNEDALPLDTTMDLWFSTYDWTGIESQSRFMDRVREFGTVPFTWQQVMQEGTSLADARSKTSSEVPQWPLNYASAVASVKQASDDYHERAGRKMLPGSKEQLFGWFNEKELNFQHFYRRGEFKRLEAFIKRILKEVEETGDVPEDSNWFDDGLYAATIDHRRKLNKEEARKLINILGHDTEPDAIPNPNQLTLQLA